MTAKQTLSDRKLAAANKKTLALQRKVVGCNERIHELERELLTKGVKLEKLAQVEETLKKMRADCDRATATAEFEKEQRLLTGL